MCKVLHCPVCGKQMRTYEQTMYNADRTTYQTTCAECLDYACAFHHKTASEQYLQDGSFIARWNAGIVDANIRLGQNDPLITVRFDLTTGQPLSKIA